MLNNLLDRDPLEMVSVETFPYQVTQLRVHVHRIHHLLVLDCVEDLFD